MFGSRWLKTLCVSVAGLTTVAAGNAAVPAAPDSPPFTLSEIGPGVFAAIDGPPGRSGSNAGFVIGDDGVLVVDSFFDPAATRALVAEIRKRTTRPIRYVVNTHYHIDHVGGDAVLKDAGAAIIAQRNVRGWVRTENLHLFGDRVTPALAARIAALPLPDVTTDQGVTVWLGTRKVEVRFVAGHTGGDLVVRVPDAHAVFCGDMVWRHVSPNVIDGTIARWIDSVDALRTAPDSAATVFVPGHGDIARAGDLAEFSGYLRDLHDVVGKARARGLSGQMLVDASLPEFTRLHGDWTAFSHFAPLELRYMDEELAGTKRTPRPAAD